VTLTTADVASSTGEDGLVASSAKGPRASQPKRRSFTAAYKLQIVEQYDQLADPRERGALLRREGLYHSHIQQWREARDKGALKELSDKPPGRPSRSQAEVENERLRKENGKLATELARTQARSGKSDRRRIYRAGAGYLSENGMPAARQTTRHALPPA
jgi:transposase-like protein